jgi:hypothetical protein
MRQHLTLKANQNCKMIVSYFGSSVKEYLVKISEKFLNLSFFCPDCGGSCTLHGSYPRHFINNQVNVWFRLQRVICSVCGKAHSLIPDFLYPHKHYPVEVVEAFCEAYSSGIPIDMMAELAPSIETLRLWVSSVGQFCSMAGAALLRRYSDIITDFMYINSNVVHPFIRLRNIIRSLPEADFSGFVLTLAWCWLSRPPWTNIVLGSCPILIVLKWVQLKKGG